MNDIKCRVLENIKEIRVLNDPYRQEILKRMTSLGKPATSKEIATAMKEAPSKVNYHLKVLEKYNFVELDHTENINGIIAKYYKRAVTNFNLDLKNDDDSKGKANAIISMMESLFNNARDKHIRRLMETFTDGKKENEKDLLTSTKLYLNNSEIEQLNELLRRFMENDKEGRDLYDVFFSFIKES